MKISLFLGGPKNFTIFRNFLFIMMFRDKKNISTQEIETVKDPYIRFVLCKHFEYRNLLFLNKYVKIFAKCLKYL
jgi:hypothetical protein